MAKLANKIKNNKVQNMNGNEMMNLKAQMKNQIDDVNTTNRVYFNKFDPIIYTKIVDNHVELALRFLMHPKKARYIESVIWNKIYLGYKEGKINLYVKD